MRRVRRMIYEGSPANNIEISELVEDNVHTVVEAPSTWPSYRKVTLTRALRMVGPFEVQTVHEGLVTCEDGYLAVDAQGFPYPIAADEFALIYEPADG